MTPNDYFGEDAAIDFANTPAIAVRRMIEARFSVSPHLSMKAWEDFTMPDGEELRLVHYVFGYMTQDSDKVEEMAKSLWEEVKAAWPPGAFLMWRRYPLFEAHDKNFVKITLRIGSFVPPENGGHVNDYPIDSNIKVI